MDDLLFWIWAGFDIIIALFFSSFVERFSRVNYLTFCHSNESGGNRVSISNGRMSRGRSWSFPFQWPTLRLRYLVTL